MNSSLTRSGLLLFLDLIGIYGSYNFAHKIRLDVWVSPTSGHLWILIIVAILVLYIMDVYRLDDSHASAYLPLDAFVAILVVAVSSVLITYIVGVSKFVPLFGRGVLPVAMAMFALWGSTTRWLFLKWYEREYQVVNWLLICNEEVFDSFNQDNKAKIPNMKTSRVDVGSSGEPIKKWLEENTNRCGIIFQSNVHLSKDIYRQLKSMGIGKIPIRTFSEYYEQYWMKLPVLNLEDGWFIRNQGFSLLHDHVGIRLKRVADFLFAVIGLIVTSPLAMCIALLIYFESPGNIIFKQRRVGRNGKNFTLYKFRSMIEDAEKVGAQWSGQDDPRITRLGKFLRASRLDELPQLWNVIVGNMSLIGPRPERPEFIEQLEKEIPFYDMRHLVSPGLTGWAQVMYSYGSSVEDARIKLEYDLYYIKNHSIRLDLIIILKTVAVVLTGGGR